jgi:hypothetical protein
MVSPAFDPASQSQRSTSSVPTSGARNNSNARTSVGIAAAYPSVHRSANASSTTSTARGGSGPGGAARAASAAFRRPPGRPRHRPTARPERASYAWGAASVIFVVGAQKLVPTLDAARERIYKHSFVREDARAIAAYGQNSAAGKILRIHQELPGRIHVVLVRQVVGF